MQLIVDIPRTPHRYLSPNRSSRLPKMAHAREVEKARKLARERAETLPLTEWRAALQCTIGSPRSMSYELEWMVGWEKGHKFVDQDNLIAMLKSYQDGVADALGINDKHFTTRIHSQYRDPEGEGLMRLVITPI